MKRNWPRLAGLLLVLIVVGYLGVRLALAARSLTDTACTNPNARRPGWAILLASAVFFVAGHFVAGQRHDAVHVAVPHRRRWLNGALAVHVALAIFFLCTAGALAYETVGVWDNPWKLQPITDYVRCARSADPTITMLIAVTASFFAGHWLWFPRRRRT